MLGYCCNIPRELLLTGAFFPDVVLLSSRTSCPRCLYCEDPKESLTIVLRSNAAMLRALELELDPLRSNLAIDKGKDMRRFKPRTSDDCQSLRRSCLPLSDTIPLLRKLEV
ncbi:unnamed protein product [Symbiodinium natans]|uniref:Uncharacterized protein n=1 Tax=Symbiodinium natans TaxID=878477 RepID=A0A812MI48_9DINO|nr:unnamed protein product [Symbiodinium natans]